jgi:hypothetical protein
MIRQGTYSQRDTLTWNERLLPPPTLLPPTARRDAAAGGICCFCVRGWMCMNEKRGHDDEEDTEERLEEQLKVSATHISYHYNNTTFIHTHTRTQLTSPSHLAAGRSKGDSRASILYRKSANQSVCASSSFIITSSCS